MRNVELSPRRLDSSERKRVILKSPQIIL